MELKLGVASFVYYFKLPEIKEIFCKYGIDLHMPNNKHIEIISPNFPIPPLPINDWENKNLICGFIKINDVILKNILTDIILYNQNAFDYIKKKCEKKPFGMKTKNKPQKQIHCPIEDDLEKRGNIPTTLNGKDFNCKLEKINPCICTSQEK